MAGRTSAAANASAPPKARPPFEAPVPPIMMSFLARVDRIQRLGPAWVASVIASSPKCYRGARAGSLRLIKGPALARRGSDEHCAARKKGGPLRRSQDLGCRMRMIGLLGL